MTSPITICRSNSSQLAFRLALPELVYIKAVIHVSCCHDGPSFMNALGTFCCCQVQEPLYQRPTTKQLNFHCSTSCISIFSFPYSCTAVNLLSHTRNDSAHSDAGRHHLLDDVFLMCSLGSPIFPKVIMAEPRCYSLFREDVLLLSSTKTCAERAPKQSRNL